MLIILGGMLGSGRGLLAEHLAKDYQLYSYDIDALKSRRLTRGRDIVADEPRTDAERMRVYRRAAENLPLLSKMHPEAIVHDPFHRKESRDFFLEAARASYEVVFIWIETDEASARERLRRAYEAGKWGSLEAAERAWDTQRAELQEPPEEVPRFSCVVGGGIGQVAQLWRLIERSRLSTA